MSVFVPEGLTVCIYSILMYLSFCDGLFFFNRSCFWDSQHKYVNLNVLLYANRCKGLQFMRNTMAELVPKYISVCGRAHKRTRASCPDEAFVIFWFNLSVLATGLDLQAYLVVLYNSFKLKICVVFLLFQLRGQWKSASTCRIEGQSSYMKLIC